MCHSILTLCPSCKSNIRTLSPCPSGSTTSSNFKYTSLTAEVCSATGSLLSVKFAYGDCEDCIRYAKADADAKANVEAWQQELNLLTSRAQTYSRRTALRPGNNNRKSVDTQGGRKALLKLWYNEARDRSLRALHAGSEQDPGTDAESSGVKSQKSPKIARFSRSPRSPKASHFTGLAVPGR